MVIGVILFWFIFVFVQDCVIMVVLMMLMEQFGFFGYLLFLFQRVIGIGVKVVVVGIGQVFDIGWCGDVDVVFVYDKVVEDKFMLEGQGVRCFDVMYNDFVIIGFRNDLVKIVGDKDVVDVLCKIVVVKVLFILCGDKFGIYVVEFRLWKDVGVDFGMGKDVWYCEIGQGMGLVFNMVLLLNVYVLLDCGIWLLFRNCGEFVIFIEGDKCFFNQYGVMLVNFDKYFDVKVKDGQVFVDWFVLLQGQDVIVGYKVGGEQLFFFNVFYQDECDS